MSQRRPFGARLRWAVPAAAVVASGAVLAGTMLASAAAPALPRQTPAQLLAAMRQAKLPGAMTASITESANLGFPALPDIGGLSSSSPLSAASLVSGTHTIQIWYSGPRQIRIALPVSFGETDLRVNKDQVWLWDSRGQTATHFLPPPANRQFRGAAGRSDKPAVRPQFPRGMTPLTPLQAARRLLALIGPTTRVTVAGTTVVAGRDAYQLAIAPRSSQSLVGKIVIAVDARTHLPLSVQVFARGSSAPAFGLGFTSLSFSRPAASNFRFTPPPGAHTKTVRFPAAGPGIMPGMGPAGGGWSGVPPVGVGGGPQGGVGGGRQAGARTFGAGWLTVAAIPAGPMMAFAATNAAPGRHVVLRPKSTASGAYSSSLTVSGPAAVGPGVLGLLLKAARPVHGAWGSGRLLRTSLISVLLTSKGQLLVGAVTPAVLYADAAKVK